MRSNTLKSVLIKSGLAASALLLAGAAFGQQQINLTAGPATTTLPDGTTVPMWGYSCGAVVSGSTATCAASNPAATGSPAIWSPVVITVPTGQTLQINLTNNLTFTTTSGANSIPTSLVIVGQLGGGLGNSATSTPSPDHSNAQPATWPIAGSPPGTPLGAPGTGVGTPPPQGPRVQSFATEVAAGATTLLTWTTPRPGTYLIESGTHPSIQGPMGLYGILVVTSAPTTTGGTETAAGTAYPGVSYDADVSLLLSEIDPVQNNAVSTAVNTAGFSETAVWTGQPGGCGNPASPPTCYPPAVNYTPLYYMVNGVAFDKTNAAASQFRLTPQVLMTPTTTTPGRILVRLVNAGLRMHVPAVVGSLTGANPAVAPTATGVPGISLIAEDGNVLPGVPRVQNEVFMAAGKTYDVMINPTSGVTGVATTVGGAGYDTNVQIGFSGGGGSGASARALVTFSLSNTIGITSGGACYSVGDVLTFNGGQGSSAAATVTATDGTCATVSGAGAITGVTFSNVGSGYTSAPSVGVTSTTATTSAVLTAALDPTTGTISGITVQNAGTGYTSAPQVVITDTGATITTPASATATLAPAGTLPVYDRQLSLSANATARDAGMLAYITLNSTPLPSASSLGNAVARADTYNSVVSCAVAPCNSVVVSDPSKGLIGNDTNVSGVQVLTQPSGGTLTLNRDGTFTYVPNAGTTSDSFTYCANGTVTGTNCSSGITAAVTLGACTSGSGCLELASGITVGNDAYTSPTGPTTTLAARLAVSPPGVLANDKDGAGHPLTVDLTTVTQPAAGATVSMSADGSFVATATTAGTYSFTYKAKNSQGTTSSGMATVTLTFPTASGLAVTVIDGADKTTRIADYRWIIEEDRTFYVDPNCTTNPPPAGCPSSTSGIVPTFGTNFHTSYMPVVATGCTGPQSCEALQTILDPTSGAHVNAVCDIGNGVCHPDTTGNGWTPVLPSQVHLDATKRYYISVLPGDAGNPFEAGNLTATCSTFTNGAGTTGSSCGHGMGGAPVAFGQTSVNIYTQPTPFPPSKLSVFVFEDDFPLNGEQDGGGGIDVLSPNEPGLGGFNIILFDDAGGPGDATGQMTYDMFNQPLSNSLAGSIDPVTGLDACPISAISRIGPQLDANGNPIPGTLDPTQTGITGTIVTCPKYEADNVTLSPLAGQAVVANLMPGRYGVVATPGADRIARGEEWLQTNTLDGQKAHDSFLRIGEPAFFQEFGPAGYHVSIGFANPAIINGRKAYVCNGTDANITGTNCTNSVTGMVTTERMSRTPDERLYSSGSNDSFAFTQCYVSFGDADGEDFAFTKCNADGSFTLSGLPDGDWRITVFDQWNDMLVDGLSTPVRLAGGNTVNLGQLATNQWQSNIYTTTFFDANRNGVRDANETGLALVATNNRFRDGSFSNFNNTDLNGYAGFNEIFPLFSWYVIETDSTRYKNTGTHVVYDAGGPADGSSQCQPGTTAPCGNSGIGQFLANTAEQVSVPTTLRVPGAVYCAGADCATKSIASGPASSDPPTSGCALNAAGQNVCTTQLSTGRIDPPWVLSEGWQGFSGQNNFIEFGKTPFAPGENGGIRGHVVYASTRPFDDPQLLLQLSWEPLVPNVTINLYQVGTAADGSQSLTLVDTTKTSSWDDWSQGFRSDGVPNMNCPGQLPAPASGQAGDLFFFSLFNQPNWLDVYNNGINGAHALPNNAQFKCYDGMHNWNQVQPAPYDGMYQFPSIVARNPTSGAPTGTGTAVSASGGSLTGTNCTVCVANPTDGTPMLPNGKYVVEVVVPRGYELVKEEDKNILIGDNYIAPVTVQFPGLGGSIYILPDQAAVGSTYNATNAQNPTMNLGRIGSLSSHEGDTGSVESFWPCVGTPRIVPDYISLFPQSLEVAPFAGATRNLCDRKLVTLDDQTSALAKFYVFTSTHAAAHFTGVITDDYTSEFDPFSPQFGEKFSPADLPVAIKDWTGNEISRVYADHWGSYNGLTYSTWEVNPPNPTGYAPTMMITCMNDAGTGTTPDPLYNPAYSQFCYEIPFMPGQTQYMDTPVVPTSAFAGAGYNNPDCAYPDATPAISEVDGDGIGPWVAAATGTHTLKIAALGDQPVNNYGYSGPSANTAPWNQKKVTRHYGFGSVKGTVSIGGVNVSPGNITTWNDSQIIVNVPTGVPSCAIQQQAQYKPSGTTTAQCGELVITAANGKQSIDTVTVTIGGKAPVHVAATGTSTASCTSPYGTIQQAIDCAAPGDLIIVDPATPATPTKPAVPAVHQEILVMWKPVRLQGVAAASAVVNANTHPAGKMDVWRRQVNCLFGLALNGQPQGVVTGPPGSPTNNFDPTGTYSCPGAGWQYYTGGPNNPQIDRLPLEAVVGWDASQNGNLAELLQEPSLMGALEGAGITVLSKGLSFPPGTDPYGLGAAAAGAFPAGTTLLTGTTTLTGTLPVGDANSHCHTSSSNTTNPYPSNFQCNPSAVDGLTVTNSSQGGGGIFVHGWGHNVQIANNRVTNNAGTLGGGINVGQGEFPGAYTQGGTNADPGPCQTGGLLNTQLPYCFDINVNVHNNYVSLNSSTGDELFSATPAGGGGVNICNGSDYYKFNNNWVCGNLSTGDGGGLAHIGYSYNGDIEHNTIIFNQSTNPTIPTNGGGVLVMGAPDVDPTCGGTTDQDCLNPTPTAPGDGIGPNLVINANLLLGNGAESGSGGGLRFQGVNGTDVLTFPNLPANWYQVNVTNNIIVNNVAGWDGGGISLYDALKVNIVNNTIASNDTTASSGALFNTIGAPLASSQGPCSVPRNPDGTCPAPVVTSTPQAAGLVSVQHSSNMTANLPAAGAAPNGITCPANHFTSTAAKDGNCRTVSIPELFNNVFWENHTFYVAVGSLGPGTVNQQNVVALYNGFTTTQAPSQPATDATVANGSGQIVTGGTGACVGTTATTVPVNIWDIGVRGDLSPTSHDSGVTLAPFYSVLTSIAGPYGAAAQHNTAANPTFMSQYCNGSRVPPEALCYSVAGLQVPCGWQVPPGIADATVPNPTFSLTPSATVDEGNNWINISWGPLSLSNPTSGVTLGNYGPAAGSPVINYIPQTGAGATYYAAAPATDFYGNSRKNGFVDAGAVEFTAAGQTRFANVSPTALAFGNWAAGTVSAPMTITVENTGTLPLAGGAFTFGGGTPQPFSRPAGAAGGTCGTTLAVGASCTINVIFTAPASGSFTRNLTIVYTGATVIGSPVSLNATVVAARGTVAATPLTITLPSGTATGIGTVTLTNTTTGANASSVAVTSVGVSGGTVLTWFFNKVAGADNCTGTALAPGASCTVGVRFTNVLATRPGTHTGTITFTDTATGSPQSATLTGIAN